MKQRVVSTLCAIGAASAAACSSPSPPDGPTAEATLAATTRVATVRALSGGRACDADTPCGPGNYCTPANVASCGAGTCVASPRACPMLDMPVCGCDGNVYMNACWATMGPRGGSGTTSAGQLFATFQLSDLVGVWRPTGASTIDALTLDADNSYELVEHDGPDGGVSNSTILDSGASVSEECGTETTSSGSFTLSAYGVVLAPRSSSHADSIAIDFYVENTCPIGGPVRLVSEGTAEEVVLVHEE